MIIALKNGYEIVVQFKKTHRISNGKDVIDTHCSICKTGKKVLAVGVALLNPKDHYSKFIGKKLALTRAMEYDGYACGISWAPSKKERTIIWRAFLEKFNITK